MTLFTADLFGWDVVGICVGCGREWSLCAVGGGRGCMIMMMLMMMMMMMMMIILPMMITKLII